MCILRPMDNAPGKRQRPSRQSNRFEGISLVYLAFFVLAVLAPSIVTKDYFGIRQMYWEEILIFITGLGSLITFSVYERLMEKRIQERDAAAETADRAKRELVESYKYIGSMNRQMEVLKKLTNETSISLVKSDAYWKDLLHSLASNAATCAGSGRVLIRFVEVQKLRTEREVSYGLSDKRPIKFANKDLRTLHESGAGHAFLTAEDGTSLLVIPSDKRDSDVKAHMLIAADPSSVTDMEISLLKVFANQAELVYHHLIREKAPTSPLMLMDAVMSEQAGEIS